MLAQKYKVSIIGINGNMGQTFKKILKNHPKFVLHKGFKKGDSFNFTESDLVIDFSAPSAFLEYKDQIKVPLIIGSTNLNNITKKEIEKLSKKIPMYYTSNMSLGIHLIKEIIKQNKDMLVNNFKISINETHHKNKKDSPSGTALDLAKEFTLDNIPIISVRNDNTFGNHTISLQGEDEIITITHEALNRELFAKGALKAAEKILETHK